MQFDLMSDTHVDRWDTEHHVHWENTKKSDIIVVPGDISDNITQTVEELRYLSNIYEHVFFVEGNHEHQHYWPDFDFAPNYLREHLGKISNVHYLHDDYYVLDNVAFLGRSGWWDFKFAYPYVTEEASRAKFIADKSDMCDAIVDESDSDFYYLHDKIVELQSNNTIESVVMVTHTVPLPRFISLGEYPPWPEYSGFLGNSMMPSILDADHTKKIKAWAFGHNHDQKRDIHKGVQFISNPRGRPVDYNREIYYQIVVNV